MRPTAATSGRLEVNIQVTATSPRCGSRLLAILPLLFAHGGCAAHQHESAADAAPKSPPSAPGSEERRSQAATDGGGLQQLTHTPHQPAMTLTAKAHMQDHLDQAERLRMGVQQGDLESVRNAAAWLAEHELTPRLSGQWKPHVEKMQRAARSAKETRDLDAAALYVGQMGEACASCHLEIAGPKIPESSPPAGDGLEAQMALHAWAAQQMWLGLMAPSDDAWVRGAEAMARSALTPEELFVDRSPSADLLALEDQVRQIANVARTVKDVDATDERRGEHYAHLLATCSACHTRTVRPR